MLLKTTTLFALLATATAAPAPLDKRLNGCGISSFTSEVSSSSPLSSDCQWLVSVLAQPFLGSGGWELSGSWSDVLTYDSCAFSARSIRGARATIGNEDAYDLLRDSLRDGARNGRVGARGEMKCGNVDVEWRVGAPVGQASGGGPSIGFGKRAEE